MTQWPVYPDLSIAEPAIYQPMSSAVRAVKAAVPDELFLVMLDLEIIAVLEGQPATTHTWSFFEWYYSLTCV